MLAPRMVSGMHNRRAFKVACGAAHTVVICGSGQAFSCGWKDNGRLGRNPPSAQRERVFGLIGHPRDGNHYVDVRGNTMALLAHCGCCT